MTECQQQAREGLTLVALLLDLDLLGEVLTALPLDLVSDSSVIDKVTSVSDLLLRLSVWLLEVWFGD